MHTRKRRLAMLTLLFGVLTAPAGAHRAFAGRLPLPSLPEVNLVRLEGHLGERRPTDKGTTDLRVSYRGKNYRMQLTRLQVLTGSRLPGRILSDVTPLHPNFFLRGADTMVQRLDAPKSDDPVTITAYLRAGSRDLMVTEITVGAPPSPGRSPTPPAAP